MIARAGGQGNAMGSYQYTAGDDTWQWSDGIYAIHGFHRGVLPPASHQRTPARWCAGLSRQRQRTFRPAPT